MAGIAFPPGAELSWLSPHKVGHRLDARVRQALGGCPNGDGEEPPGSQGPGSGGGDGVAPRWVTAPWFQRRLGGAKPGPAVVGLVAESPAPAQTPVEGGSVLAWFPTKAPR